LGACSRVTSWPKREACLLALVLAVVGGTYLGQRWHQHAELLAMPLPAALRSGGELILSGLLLVAGAGLVRIGGCPLQRLLLQRRLRTTVQEMKEEFKEAEGSRRSSPACATACASWPTAACWLPCRWPTWW